MKFFQIFPSISIDIDDQTHLAQSSYTWVCMYIICSFVFPCVENSTSGSDEIINYYYLYQRNQRK
ncbi:hypothetical protein pb186bvf_015283 [Paramecium bursaria]